MTADDARRALPTTPTPARRLPGGAEGVLVGVLVFAALLLTRSHVLDQPPVWDGAMSVAPAALTLVDNGFDLPDLLRQDPYLEGGPNAHATSVHTLATAAVIAITGDLGEALPLLHLLSFALTGVLAAGVHTIVRGALAPRAAAWSAAVLTVLYPATIVQASDIYVDLPLAVAVVWTLAFALRHRFGWATLLLCVAVWVKPTGVSLIPAVAYLALTDTETPYRRRWAAVSLAVPAAITGVIFFATRSSAVAEGVGSTLFRMLEIAVYGVIHTLWHPAFLVLLAASFASLIVLARFERAQRLSDPAHRLVQAMTASLVACGLFYALNPAVTTGFYLMPRYTVALAPVLIIIVVGALAVLGTRHLALGSAALGITFLTLLVGILPDSAPGFFPISEGDLTYERHLDVQQRSMRHFESLGVLMPLYYDHFAHYAFQYPEMGWTERRPTSGTPVFLAGEDTSFQLRHMPSEFALRYDTRLLGGDTLHSIWQAAEESSSHDVEVVEFRNGRLVNYVVVVRKVDVNS